MLDILQIRSRETGAVWVGSSGFGSPRMKSGECERSLYQVPDISKSGKSQWLRPNPMPGNGIELMKPR